ncbi:recombinase family protein [Patescibacteria group bacterium]|nr:recombinase family protein [Patescibacteria group bacterium]
MVDTEKIKSLKFPTFWFENTPQGKFMLNIAFGQSKYFIDSLSENVKRGFRQKIRRGEYPAMAPIGGYLNDLRTHTLILDPHRHKLVRKIFELYSQDKYSIKDLQKVGLTNRKGKLLNANRIQDVLKRPIYYGVFLYNGEMHQGIHKPIISKQLFDKVQAVMQRRGKKRKNQNHNFSFTGFIKCICGCAITAERQKGHVYYRCTKKKGFCTQRYVREEKLVLQFKETLKQYSISDNWADKMLL